METAETAKTAWRARRAALFRSVLSPPPKLTVSQWADRYRILSRENSAEPGRWSTARAPYLREIMDVAMDSSIERIVFQKSAQVGGTEALNNVLGYFIDQDPCPILVVQITDQEAQKWSKEKLAPMLRDTPRLRGKVREPRSRNSDNTILAKAFPGGHLGIVGANAPSGLRARPRRVVLMDEIDGYPASAGTEGDPITLATKRTTTFWNRKILLVSTPTLKGKSRIEKAYGDSDQRELFVPCPHCDHGQVLQWGGRDCDYGLKWEPGQPDTVRYLCEQCHQFIEEIDKMAAVTRGRWIAGRPEARGTAGFKINALVSLFEGARWPRLVAEWLEVKDDPVRMQAFANTVWGETWEERGAAVDANTLIGRIEEYPHDAESGEVLIPKSVAVLTRSVDVQGDRLETAVWGWGAGQEAWPVDFQMIPGDPATLDPWRALTGMLRQGYRHESGVRLVPEVTFVDSGGHHTKAVYEFTRTHVAERVFAIKGSSLEGAPLLSNPSRRNSARAILYMIGVFTAKEWIVARLNAVKEPGPGYIHVPDWLDTEQISQLTNENLQTRYPGGKRKRIWVKTGRNEFFDLFVYALAALHLLGLGRIAGLGDEAAGLEERAKTEKAQDAAKPKDPAQPERRSGWMNSWRR